ncbi:alpha/beta fold hydrolase [bacterium AH-315-C20]|nr:alpha/beta fold hydrolase [bacterium AH-315-C20]
MRRSNYIHLFLLLLFLTVQGCSFNNLFYYPNTKTVAPSEKGEDIYLEWTKNDTFHGVFYTAENPIGSVYLLHGNAGNLTGWSHMAEILWNVGFNAFIIDYPGFGNSDKKPRHNRVAKSAQVGFDYFVNREEVKGTKKILFGMSLGGNLATRIGVDNQDQLDAMVIEGGFTNHHQVGLMRVPGLLKPIAFFGIRTAIPGQRLMKKWTKPLLVVHSDEDKVCAYKMGVELYEKSPSENKEFWTIKGRHLRGMAEYRAEYLEKFKALVK